MLTTRIAVTFSVPVEIQRIINEYAVGAYLWDLLLNSNNNFDQSQAHPNRIYENTNYFCHWDSSIPTPGTWKWEHYLKDAEYWEGMESYLYERRLPTETEVFVELVYVQLLHVQQSIAVTLGFELGNFFEGKEARWSRLEDSTHSILYTTSWKTKNKSFNRKIATQCFKAYIKDFERHIRNHECFDSNFDCTNNAYNFNDEVIKLNTAYNMLGQSPPRPKCFDSDSESESDFSTGQIRTKKVTPDDGKGAVLKPDPDVKLLKKALGLTYSALKKLRKTCRKIERKISGTRTVSFTGGF